MTAFERLEKELRTHPKVWLITGAAGFIGSNLVEALLKLDQPVRGLDNFATSRRRNLDEVQSQVTSEQWRRFSFFEGDIRDPSACQQACSSVDFVLHQAALGSVPQSIADPLTANAVNVDGTLQMLAAARDQKVQAVVYASTSAIYGDDPQLPKTEEQISEALSPYAVTKHANELYAGVFSRCYGMKAVGLRYFNVFGPRQDPNGPYAAVIPAWIQALLRDEPVHIYGDGETSRDFCYVTNVVQANLLAAATHLDEKNHDVYNVAVGQRITLNELFHSLRDLLAAKFPRVRERKPIYGDFRVGDVRHSVADIRRAMKKLGYAPTHRTADGLALALDWYIRVLSP
jgi:UDP-N-acetylglucosamine 4-epimerase